MMMIFGKVQRSMSLVKIHDHTMTKCSFFGYRCNLQGDWGLLRARYDVKYFGSSYCFLKVVGIN